MKVVERLHKEFQELVNHLDSVRELSLRSVVDENFKKVLLLASASYFEVRVREDVLANITEIMNQNEHLIEFIKNRALDSRQYHSLFNWEAKNANHFFKFFGESFKKYMDDEIKNDDKLAQGILAFIEIGSERNRLVHQNFGTLSLEKTVEEIFEKHQQALYFVDNISVKLRNYLSKPH